jgi:hypothetical protein
LNIYFQMATATPFAYNTGSTIAGTIQVGDLAAGFPTVGFSATGLQWWNGPDEDLGYVITHTVPAGNQPNPLNIPAYLGFWRSPSKTEGSFVSYTNFIFGTSFTTGDQCKTYLNNNGYWTSWSGGVSAVTFSQTFTSGVSPGTTIETAWTTFRSQLTGIYTKFDFYSSNGQGYTGITDSVKVQQLADAIRTGTTGVNLSVAISGVSWNVGCCTCRAGGAVNGAVEFANIALCSAASTAALRPFINNPNWGGIGVTVNAATQTLTLKFY